MTVRMTQSHYDLIPNYEFEEEDRLRADMLPVETEVKIKEWIYQLQQEYMNIHLVGGEDEQTQIRVMAHIKGKLEVLVTLLESSKEARVKQTLNT